MRTSRDGFTLVELLVVLAILALLVSLAIPALNQARTQAKNTQVKSNINKITGALERYGLDNNNFFPGIHYTDLDPDSPQSGLVAGPGVIGGVATGEGTRDFMSPNQDNVQYFRNNYYGPDGQPISWVDSPPSSGSGGTVEGGGGIDKLLVGGYLNEYPVNPFLQSGGESRSQMSNTMLIRVDVSNGQLNTGDSSLVSWNRFVPGGAGNATMRTRYDNYGRGYFTYIPLDPVNRPPLATSCSGNTLQVTNWGSLNDDQRSQFYQNARNYVLVGWGHSRQISGATAGLSQSSPEGIYNSQARNVCGSQGGPDFDGNGKIDVIENNIGSIIQPHLFDSEGNSYTKFGQSDPLTGFPNLNPGFFGAVVITGNNTDQRSS